MQGYEVRIIVQGEELKLFFQQDQQNVAMGLISTIFDAASEYDDQDFSVVMEQITEKA